MESTMVTTAARPSGMAATARLTAIINVSMTVYPEMSGYARSKLTANIITQIPSTSTLRIRLS